MSDQRRAVRDGYDKLAAEYDAQRSDDPDFLDEFCERLPANARILDAGCGSGRPVAAALAGDYDLVGIDFSREQIRLARENAPAGRFSLQDVTTLAFADRTFDAICAYHSVIHVPISEQSAVAHEFYRVLRPGGHLLVTIGGVAWEGSEDDWLDTGVEMHWSIPAPEESESILEAAGFEVIWRRVVDDSLGDETCFVLARKPKLV